MNYDDKIDQAIRKLEDDGVVPLDEIFDLVSTGHNFRDLDNKYNKHNKTYADRPSRRQRRKETNVSI
jgi:hypothetical protein